MIRTRNYTRLRGIGPVLFSPLAKRLTWRRPTTLCRRLRCVNFRTFSSAQGCLLSEGKHGFALSVGGSSSEVE